MADPTDTVALPSWGRAGTALLTTFRRNGTPVATPVSVATHAGRAFFVTPAGSGKAKRLAHTSRVSLAPCTVSGVATGDPVSGTARLLEGPERRQVRRLLRPGGPLFWSYLLYRVRGNTMVLYEVVPAPAPPDGSDPQAEAPV